MKRAAENAAQKLFRAVTGRSPDVRGRGVAAKVREFRQARRGASNRDLARELKVSPRTLQRWQAGTQEPRGRNAKRLDRQMRKSMTEQRSGRLRDKVITFRVRVRIGAERERTRTFKVTDPADRAKLGQAAASTDAGAVMAVMGQVIRNIIGQSRDYPVEVSEVFEVNVS